MTNPRIELHRKNLELLIKHSDLSNNKFVIENDVISLKSKQKRQDNWALFAVDLDCKQYLAELMEEIKANPDSKEWETLFILGEKAKHLLRRKPNFVLGAKSSILDSNYSDEFVEIIYDDEKKQYRSPDDDKFGEHGNEAKNIFLSTQSENIKEILHHFFKFLGIHVFESAVYKEHDYIPTDIYANDLAIKPYSKEPSHYWAGHAENLLQLPTKNGSIHVLTDPVEGNLNALFYPRKTDVANRVNGEGEKMLPHIDVIVISHNHRDHVDVDTLKRLVSQQPIMVIPKGDRALFEGLGFLKENIVETVWWDQVEINDNDKSTVLNITAVPTRHWSNRGLCDAHRSSFNGYVIRNEQADHKDIYFAGDTALMKEKTSAPIYKYFKIGLSIQPGGPDEMRGDMKSTHQSSADALLMHFKKLRALYVRKQGRGRSLNKIGFFNEIKEIRTVFNHTATFKLGNLHLRDTFYSINRVIAAFKEGHEWAVNNLESYEMDVYAKIHYIADEMNLHGETLTSLEIAEILQNSVIMPKIGERQGLHTTYEAFPFSYRNLIVQKRGLEEFDKITSRFLKDINRLWDTDFIKLKKLTKELFNAYQKPWYSRLTRNYRNLSANALNDIEQCHNKGELLEVINTLANSGSFNRYGHMHALLNYTKWVIHAESLEQVVAFLQCKEKRELINEEVNRKGFGRKEKQELFKDLGHRLAREKSITPGAYNKIIIDWQEKNKDVLHKHRFFGIGKTKSEQSIEAAITLDFSKK